MKDLEEGAFEELKSCQMLGAPQGLKRHIKHNITSCTGVQSLVLSRELLHYVLLPQFKSQEVKSNAAQTGGWPTQRGHLGDGAGFATVVQTVFLFVLV